MRGVKGESYQRNVRYRVGKAIETGVIEKGVEGDKEEMSEE